MNVNISKTQHKSLNRQEVLAYMLLGAMGIFVLMAATLLLWTLSPLATVSSKVFIGDTADFPLATEPYLIRLELTEKEIEAYTESNTNFLPSIWLVHTEKGWLAFDRYTPSFGFSKTQTCIYYWVPTNGRFEDPCFGSKFSLDGQLINPPATRNLTTYPVIIEGNKIQVDLSQPTPGEMIEPLCRLDDRCL